MCELTEEIRKSAISFRLIEKITLMMLSQAERGNWEQVEALEQRRKLWLSAYCLKFSSDECQRLQSRLKRVLDWDCQVMELARIRQVELDKLFEVLVV